jgi:hypothetical protein
MKMKIDPKVESVVRQILDAAVKQEFKRFSDSLRSFDTEAAAQQGLNLAASVCLVLLHQRYGGSPSEAQLSQLVETITGSEAAWSSLEAGDFQEALTAIVENRPALGPEGDSALAIAPFVLAAFLLAGMTQKPKWWFETLDEVEATLEAGGPS